MTNSERLMALAGNLKNWDWSVYPQFKLEKEDGEALLSLLCPVIKLEKEFKKEDAEAFLSWTKKAEDAKHDCKRTD